jgi:hypothetical protein
MNRKSRSTAASGRTRTGDGRPLSKHLKAEICRELDRLELVLTQIKAVEAERDVLIVCETSKTPTSSKGCLRAWLAWRHAVALIIGRERLLDLVMMFA